MALTRDFQLEGNIHIRTHVILIQKRQINNASECLIIYGGTGVKKRRLKGRNKTGRNRQKKVGGGPEQTLLWLTQL